MWFIEEFGKLFGVEYECRKLNLSPEDRLNYRKKHSVSMMDRIKKKLEEYFSSGYAGCGELFTKALKYARREWSAMEMVLENGGLELSNNLAEQMMRHFKRTLKNCLVSVQNRHLASPLNKCYICAHIKNQELC
jgi:hypothetical protein